MSTTKKKRNRPSKTGRKRKNFHPPRWRANEYTERIYQWFLRPLAMAIEISAEERRADVAARLELVFGGNTRAVTAVKTTATIKLPDRRWSSHLVPDSRIGGASLQERLVPVGTTLYVRRDEKYRGDVEIQYDENVFVLYEHEVEEIKDKWKVLV
jgi:hypothetical protein